MTLAHRNERDFEEFIYCITHDLKSYSRAIRVIPEWIEEDLEGAGQSVPEDVREHVAMLHSYVSGMDRTLEALTALSRVGRLADPPTDIDLGDALTEAWASLPRSGRARLDLPEAPFMIHGPWNDLQRLFGAVLSNGIDHNPSDMPRLRVMALAEGDRVLVRIADNGPGIEPPHREKVFEPLQSLRPKYETGHAGMGLAIARKVVELSGGEIEIGSSEDGGGCVVAFDLPAARFPT